MKYSECLKFVKENKLNVVQLMVAEEVNKNIKAPNYEEVCSYIYSCLIENKDIKLSQLITNYNNLLNDGYTNEEILNMRTYRFIDQASYIKD